MIKIGQLIEQMPFVLKSCKAFFRRYHRTHKKLYSCQTNGKCDVRHSIRKKKCKHCRYMKCLSVGMQDNLVLMNEDDLRKHTFRGPLVNPTPRYVCKSPFLRCNQPLDKICEELQQSW